MNRRSALLLLLLACAQLPRVPGSEHSDLVFERYTPLSSNAELARRVLTPLTVRRGEEAMATNKTALREQPIDLAKEKFSIYVPGRTPPKEGYGLLVFVAPWEERGTPKTWRLALDLRDLIFVVAGASGNETRLYDRRMPLALLAYENVRARYHVDPKRTYVGGLSGGSRTAEALALAYPDVFRGALLNAGSNPIGNESEFRLPPAELFAQFQHTRLVYVTGEKDEEHINEDLTSRNSMRSWCVFNEEVMTVAKVGHEPLDAGSFGRALDLLDRPGSPGSIDERKLAECNAGLQRDLAAKVAEADAAIARGDRDRARSLIYSLDGRYSGFAEKQVLELDTKLAARMPTAR
jgi:pimeloyl-ACP methyl ester carboxylesterase